MSCLATADSSVWKLANSVDEMKFCSLTQAKHQQKIVYVCHLLSWAWAGFATNAATVVGGENTHHVLCDSLAPKGYLYEVCRRHTWYCSSTTTASSPSRQQCATYKGGTGLPFATPVLHVY